MELYNQIDRTKPLDLNTVKALVLLMCHKLTDRTKYGHRYKGDVHHYRAELLFERNGHFGVEMQFILHKQEPIWYQNQQARRGREQYEDLRFDEKEKTWVSTWMYRPVIGNIIWKTKALISNEKFTSGFAFRNNTLVEEFLHAIIEQVTRLMMMGAIRQEEENEKEALEQLEREGMRTMQLEEAKAYIKNERLVKAEVALENA